jgi:hypothetical protein
MMSVDMTYNLGIAARIKENPTADRNVIWVFVGIKPPYD